jgi:hypothetical protein
MEDSLLGLGGSPAEGAASSAMGNSTVNSRLNVDLKMLSGLNDQLAKIGENAKKIETRFDSLIKKTKELTKELSKASQAGSLSGSSSGGYLPKGDMPAAAMQHQRGMFDAANAHQANMLKTAMGGGGGMGGGAGGGSGGGMGAIASAIATAISNGSAMLNKRIDAGAAYSLPADNISVMLQQQNGMSAQQVRSQMRAPLTKFRLGAGGINDMLALQARTGLQANQQMGSSIEGLRTLTGYGYSTGDMTNMIGSMAGPETANRMFMTLGTGMYGIGGKQNDPMSVIKSAVQRLNLTDEEIVKGGMQQGSVVRQKLANAGFDENMQTMVLQYAQSNTNFKKKGGKGMYDPSKKSDRQRMGVEDNYATQVEESQRVQTERDEHFYDRQAENFSQMEKNTQAVNKAFMKLEDTLSGLIGAKTRAKGFGKIFNVLGDMGIPFAGQIGNIIGDPVAPYKGGGGAPTSYPTTNIIATQHPTGSYGTPRDDAAQLAALDTTFSSRLKRMLSASNGKVWIAEGKRTEFQQRSEFYKRYAPAKKGDVTDTYFDGKYWQIKPGYAKLLPPGHSMHEIGQAVDLSGDLDWVTANIGKFGLRNFAAEINEAWHVQRADLPDNLIPAERPGGIKYSGEGPTNIIKLSNSADSNTIINDQQGLKGTAPRATDESGLRSYYGNLHKKLSRRVLSKNDISSLLGGLKVGGRKLTDAEIKGFTQIANRESGYNSNAYNPTASTNDLSFGLFQVNMDPSEGGTDALRKFPWLKGNYDKLWDPQTNVEVAAGWKMADGINRGNIFHHWGGTPEAPTSGTGGYKAADPVPSSPGPLTRSTGGGSTNMITVSPTINITTSGNSGVDVQQMAKEVTRILEREVRLTMMRID